MQEQLIQFETAKLAKEKGFNISSKSDGVGMDIFIEGKLTRTIFYNKNHIHAPTQSLLQKWLREVHKICIDLNVSHYNYKENCCYFYGITMFGERIPTTNKCDKEKIFLRKGHFQSYEEALEVGLQEGLKLIK